MKQKLAIIGAGEFQRPVIEKANSLGYETHVFAWDKGAVAKQDADFFYNISITEIETIYNKCLEISPSGILTCGSDLAVSAVNQIAKKLGLPCNSEESTLITTNKYKMRQAMQKKGIPTPWFMRVPKGDFSRINLAALPCPLIIKPTDRSGSRGITKVSQLDTGTLHDALENAWRESFEETAIIEEYIEGAEYSCESISYRGKHHPLAITQKFTTGDPHFIETGHLQPASLSRETINAVYDLTIQTLDALDVQIGASHFEFRIRPDGHIVPMELGARGGGDYISTDLVRLSTGYDMSKMIIQCAVGIAPDFTQDTFFRYAAVQFFAHAEQKNLYFRLMQDHPEWIIRKSVHDLDNQAKVSDSSTRHGYVIYATDDPSILNYL